MTRNAKRVLGYGGVLAFTVGAFAGEMKERQNVDSSLVAIAEATVVDNENPQEDAVHVRTKIVLPLEQTAEVIEVSEQPYVKDRFQWLRQGFAAMFMHGLLTVMVLDVGFGAMNRQKTQIEEGAVG